MGLEGNDRKASYLLALALAKKGKLIWSIELISDYGFIADKLIDKKNTALPLDGAPLVLPTIQKSVQSVNRKRKRRS